MIQKMNSFRQELKNDIHVEMTLTPILSNFGADSTTEDTVAMMSNSAKARPRKPWYMASVGYSCVKECILRWRHNGHDSVSNHQPHGCLLNRLFRGRSKKTSKLRVTGLCAGNSPGTGEFPAQMVSNVENASIWLRQHECRVTWAS